jgi:hypothetical protein
MKHATSPPLSENATSAPTFADVVRFIAGPEAPTWLVELRSQRVRQSISCAFLY